MPTSLPASPLLLTRIAATAGRVAAGRLHAGSRELEFLEGADTHRWLCRIKGSCGDILWERGALLR